jgi:hypothetical protein
MTRTIVLSFLVVAIIACKDSNIESTMEENAVNKKDLSPKEHPTATLQNIIIEKEKLLGAWTDGSSENATFTFEKDSIFYTDEMVSYPYSLTGDSLIITYPDMSFQGRAYFINDTLVLSDPEFGTTKYTRFKN